jgi:hypothetical protein
MREFADPLPVRARRAELKRSRYRMNPEQRLRAINKDRARRGYPTVSSLAECKLRLPIEEANG